MIVEYETKSPYNESHEIIGCLPVSLDAWATLTRSHWSSVKV